MEGSDQLWCLPQKRRRSSGTKAAPKQAELLQEGPREVASLASGGDNSAAVAMDVASLSAEELEKIPGLKCESIEETQQRIPSGTVKHAIFEVSECNLLSAMLCMHHCLSFYI